MKALVISGGGSKGAFAGGVAEYLLDEKKNEYDLFVGTSTGGLLLPLLALGETESIKNVYTSINQKDIFDVNPIGFSKLEERYKIKISYLRILKRIIMEKPTFGESRNLRKLIRRSYTMEMHARLQKSGKEVVVAVSNLSKEKVEYKSSNECDYDDFCDWLWASANVVPFMSLLKKDGHYYADGGFGDSIPAHEAVMRGAREIDVIILHMKERKQAPKEIKNIIGLSSAVINFMAHQLSNHALIIAELDNSRPDVTIHEWFIPRLLTGNFLVFNASEMEQWWQEGLEYARQLDASREVR